MTILLEGVFMSLLGYARVLMPGEGSLAALVLGAFLVGGTLGVTLFERIHGYLCFLAAFSLIAMSLAALHRARQEMGA